MSPIGALIVGVALLLVGFLTGIWIIWVLGVVACVIGLLLLVVGAASPATGRWR